MRRRARGHACVLATILVTVSGCAPDEPEVVVPLQTRIAQWTLGEATATLGAGDAQARPSGGITGATYGPLGGVAVLSDDGVLRWYDADGSMVRTVGPDALGGARLGGATEIGRMADTTWVVAPGEGVLLFAGGELVGERAFPPAGAVSHPERGVEVLGLLGGGPMLLATSARREGDPAVASTSAGLYAWSETGVDTLATFVADHTPARLPGGATFEQPFGRTGLVAIAPNGGAVGVVGSTQPAVPSQPSVTLAVVGAAAGSGFSVNMGYRPVPIMTADVDSTVARLVRSTGADEAAIREELFLPDHYPSVTELHFASDGSLWAQRDVVPGRDPVWTVISPQGNPAAEVTIPEGLRVLVAGPDALWVARTGEDGVQVVERRPIVR